MTDLKKKLAEIAKGFRRELAKKFKVFELDWVLSYIEEQWSSWQRAFHRKLYVENPFYDNQEALEEAKKEFLKYGYRLDLIEKHYQDYQSLSFISNIKIDHSFWENELEKLRKKESSQFNSSKTQTSRSKKRKKKKETTQKKKRNLEIRDKNPKETQTEGRTLHELLLQHWEKELLKAYHEWELEEIERTRREFLAKIEEWLSLIQQFQDVMNDLSLEPGVLFDLSQGSLTSQDIAQLKKWAQILTNDEKLKELCDLLGKMRLAEQSSKQELVRKTELIEHLIEDYTVKEEFIGIKLGNELEYVLPQELALLKDEALSLLFDKKFVEKTLMSFALKGTQREQQEREIEILEEMKEKEKLGPIILCVDTSGSMSGTPETIAKAVALSISTRAIKQKRACYLINFSTSIATLDLSGKMGIKELIHFLGQSFHGGTDVAPALQEALKKIEEKKYKKADILVISDFVMSGLSNELQGQIQKAQAQKNDFYSLTIGHFAIESSLNKLFKRQWIYDPQKTSIFELNAIGREITSL